MPYLTKDELEAFSRYKYAAVDHSLLSKALQPYWNGAVKLLPMSMAPNTVTVTGFTFVVASFLLLWSYCPTLQEPVPMWVHLYCAAAYWIYMTMDAIDGKQARRTKSSSPLGELMDHGLDAVCSTLFTANIAATLQLGPGWAALGALIAGMVPFATSALEEYTTGVMIFELISVTEANIIITLLHLAAATPAGAVLLGTEMAWLPFSLTYGQLVLLGSLVPCVQTAYGGLSRVYAHTREKGVPFMAHIRPGQPIFALSAAACVWAATSPSDVLHAHPRVFLLCTSMLGCYAIVHIILSRLCQRAISVNRVWLVMTPYVLLTAHAVVGIGVVDELAALEVYAGVAFVAYIHLATGMVREIAGFLGIHPFRVSGAVKAE